MRNLETNGDVTAPRARDGTPDEHALFEALAAQGDDTILVVDVLGRILFSNREIATLVGGESANSTLFARSA